MTPKDASNGSERNSLFTTEDGRDDQKSSTSGDFNPSTRRRRGEPELLADQERQLWFRWRESRDANARSTLILGYLWLVRQIASAVLRKMGSAYVELRDLIQWGALGLIEAVERFDPGIGVTFPAYAVKRIKGSILNELEQASEYHAQYAIRRRRTLDRIQHFKPLAKGSPAGSEVFERMTQMAVGLAVGFMLDGTSLFLASEDTQSPYDNPGELLVACETFACLIEELPAQERRLVELHYKDGMQFSDIAAVMNLTRSRISQIHSQAINRLRILFKNRSHLDVRI